MRLVSVVVPRLADRDDERVAHVVARARSPTARWRASPRRATRAAPSAPRERARRGSGPRRPRCPGRSRAPGGSRRRAARRARSSGSVSAAERARRARRRARRSCRAASCGTTPAPRMISLSRKCGNVAAVDVAGGDLGVLRARRSSTGSARAVVRRAGRCPSSVPARVGVEHDDLAPAGAGLPGSAGVSPSRRR